MEWKKGKLYLLDQTRLRLQEIYVTCSTYQEVTRAIRDRNIDIPIIFLTSNRDFRLAIEVLKYGVEDYLVKDEAVDSVLPRTILNILERVSLKRQIALQQKAEMIVQKQTDALRELIVTVCHEFNNPLAAIKISTDILHRHAAPGAEADRIRELDRNIALIEREINRLRDIGFERPPDPEPRKTPPPPT